MAHGAIAALTMLQVRQATQDKERERGERRRERLEHLDLERGVLLRPDALALVAVVVHARLPVGL